MALTDTQIFFDGNDISAVAAANIIDHDFNQLPRRELKTYKLARANKSITTSAEYSEKEVSVSFHLRGCTRSDAELVLSNLKALLRGVAKDMIVSQFGSDITYKGASLTSTEFRWFSNKIILTLVFQVANPVGFEDTLYELLSLNVTSQTNTSAISVDGSFDALPIISLTYNSVTGGTGQTVDIKNEETGQGMTISQDFATNDTLTIDSDRKVVTMNGAEIDFSGNFPVFQPGSGAFGYVDTFSDRDVDIVIEYRKRYV